MRGVVAKWGNSLALRLPKGIAEDANLGEDDPVEFKVESGTIMIKRARPRFKLDDLMAEFRPEHRRDDIDFGPAQGREGW